MSDTLLPIEQFDGSVPLLALDVDGPLNTTDHPSPRPASVRVRTAHGAKYVIDFDPAVIAALDELVQNREVELGWLTTWGPNARALVEQAFDGKLAGGYVLKKMPARYRGSIPANWKYSGLRERVTATGQRWIWVDDEAMYMTNDEQGLADLAADGRGLIMPIDETVGMTLADVASIAEFVRR